MERFKSGRAFPPMKGGGDCEKFQDRPGFHRIWVHRSPIYWESRLWRMVGEATAAKMVAGGGKSDWVRNAVR
ncbi:hypothetical protein CDL15_Pgr027549 [Punica granatum]|nr:hypothetical protein CDL15_Pgr027549 [Punica granatum]